MPVQSRRSMIEQKIREVGEVSFEDLASELRVSEMTIRRDIETLEERGVVRRVLGGAIAVHGTSVEPSFQSRVARAAEGKQHIAAGVVKLLSPRETVLIDSGSTALAVAQEIRGRDLGLTVVTPSVLVALELVDEPGTTIIMTGGQLRPGELSLVGPQAEDAYSSFNCDTYVMGVAGLDPIKGASEYHLAEGNLKRQAISCSDRVIVAIDADKLGVSRLVNVASMPEIAEIVTDAHPDHPTLQAAKASGVNVICVSAPSEE